MAGALSRLLASAISDEAAERLVTSWLLPSSLFSGLRAVVCVFAFTAIIAAFVYDSVTGDAAAIGQSFSYFTILGYWGLAFYYGFAALHSATYAVRGRSWLQDWPKPLRYAHSVLYSTVTTFPFLVTIVFWAVLANGALATPFDSYSNISKHALNSVFAFLEIVLPRSNPHPWINVIPLVIFLACYLGLAYVTLATEGFYVYSFLDPGHGRGIVAAACIGIAIGMILLFLISRYLIVLRKWFTEFKLGMNGKLSARSKEDNVERFEMTMIPKR